MSHPTSPAEGSRRVAPPDAARQERDRRALLRSWSRAPGLLGWLCTTNHKEIALRYIVTAFVFSCSRGSSPC